MEEEFHSIDLIFAQQICPNASAEASWLLSFLLKKSREGNLCIFLGEDPRLLEYVKMLPEHLFDNVLCLRNNNLYLRRNWEIEQLFISHLKRIVKGPPSHHFSQEWLVSKLAHYPLNEEQKQAICKAASQSLTLITGGPGTGKTYTASLLIRIFQAAGLKKIAVAAPTGKATANLRAHLKDVLEECTIQTLHTFLKNEHNFADLILVDEGSMIDAPLMARLFQAVKTGARLILLGDKDQLPPVESGCFFADLGTCSEYTAELKLCLRTELQEIIDKANRVKLGQMISADPLLGLKSLINKIMEEKTQVLTPLRRGVYGVDSLNQLLFKENTKRGEKKNPIIITVNDSYLSLFNGDSGFLDEEQRVAYFSGGREFPEFLLPHYEYAYALSVHKSQGSEFDHVLLVLPEGSEVFGREILYTGITRAKKKLTLLAHEGVIEKIIAKPQRRLSAVTLALKDL